MKIEESAPLEQQDREEGGGTALKNPKKAVILREEEEASIIIIRDLIMEAKVIRITRPKLAFLTWMVHF